MHRECLEVALRLCPELRAHDIRVRQRVPMGLGLQDLALLLLNSMMYGLFLGIGLPSSRRSSRRHTDRSVGMLPSMTAINTHEGTAVRTVRATERGSATRQHILAVATEAFLAHGYAGTSLSDLIRAAGVTKGGFYHHFPSKEALAVEVVRARQAEETAAVVRAAVGHDRAVDQLRAAAQVAADLKDRDEGQATSMQRLCAELAEDAELAPQIAKICDTWIDTAAGLVARAQLQGDIRADVEARQAAEVLVATFLGAEQQCVMTARHEDFRGEFRARMARCLDLLLEVLKP
jgi:AcrR family transcriptional regulator